MNRRGFLAGLGAIVGGIALEQAVPLGRVWSFPKEIKIQKYAQFIMPPPYVYNVLDAGFCYVSGLNLFLDGVAKNKRLGVE